MTLDRVFSSLRILEGLEPLHAVLLGTGLFFGGKKAVEGRETLQRWAWTFAGASTVAYVLWALLTRRAEPAVLCVFTLGFGLGLAGIWFVVMAFVAGVLQVLSSTWIACTRPIQGCWRRWSDQREHRAMLLNSQPDPDHERSAGDARIRQQEEQRRREDSRSRVLLAFRRLASRLGQLFTQEMLKEYIDLYLTDAKDAATVELRARELNELLETLARQADPEKKKVDLNTVVEEYERQKKQLDESKLEPQVKDTLLCNLRLAFTSRLQQHLEDS